MNVDTKCYVLYVDSSVYRSQHSVNVTMSTSGKPGNHQNYLTGTGGHLHVVVYFLLNYSKGNVSSSPEIGVVMLCMNTKWFISG